MNKQIGNDNGNEKSDRNSDRSDPKRCNRCRSALVTPAVGVKNWPRKKGNKRVAFRLRALHSGASRSATMFTAFTDLARLCRICLRHLRDRESQCPDTRLIAIATFHWGRWKAVRAVKGYVARCWAPGSPGSAESDPIAATRLF